MSPQYLPNEWSVRRCRLVLVSTFVASLLFTPTYSNLFAIIPVTEVVIKTGDLAPDGDGVFDLTLAGSTTAALNNRGWVGFRGNLASTTNGRGYGLFLSNGATLLQVARTTDPAFGGKFGGFNLPAVNDAGQLLFISQLTTSNLSYSLIRSESQPANFTQLLYGTQPAPDGNGTLLIANTNQPPAFNQNGQAEFVASASNTTGGSNDDSAIYRAAMAGSLIQIAREGQNVPDGNGQFGQMRTATIVHPVLNESGHVAFLADLTGTSGGSADNSGVYRGDGNTVIKIARANESLPGGGTLVSFGSDTAPDMNDSGEVAFPLSLVGGSAQQAIFKGSGGALTEIARQGAMIPNNAGTFRVFLGFCTHQ